jgi:hypothetical protein
MLYGNKRVAMVLMKEGLSQIPVATKETLGAVVVGDGLDVNEYGILSLDPSLDEVPTVGSANLVNSDGIAKALKNKSGISHKHEEYVTKDTVEPAVYSDSDDPVSSKAVYKALETKSDKDHKHEGMVVSECVSHILISPNEPTDADGEDGDLWFVYKD